MKPFVFNLEKVLSLRKFHEDEAKIELGRETGILAELETRISSLADEQARAMAAQFNPQNSAAEIQQYMYYLVRLDSTKEELLREAAEAELKVEKARKNFLEASMERKVLDKLKEKRKREYKKETIKEETGLLDDISGGVAARSK